MSAASIILILIVAASAIGLFSRKLLSLAVLRPYVVARGSGPYSGAGSGSFSMGDLHIHPPAGQPVDGARLAQDFLREIRRKGVFAGNRLRR